MTPSLLSLDQSARGDFEQRLDALRDALDRVRDEHAALEQSLAPAPPKPTSMSVVSGYLGVAVVAFLVTLLATPLVRRMALAHGIIDRPSDPRKVHRVPVAYLGGVAVFLGMAAGILTSYLAVVQPWLVSFHSSRFAESTGFPDLVPLSVVAGMTVIMLVGLWDDVFSISPRVKIGGQLLAAAMLAYQDVGVRLAEGLVLPIVRNLDIPTLFVSRTGTLQALTQSQVSALPAAEWEALRSSFRETVGFVAQLPMDLPMLGSSIEIDLLYWVGTAIIGLAVVSACNASNLIDGLDGLLSGTTAICAAGLLIVAAGLAVVDDGPRDAQRIVLCLALLGACLGFLPHNFNPATIFLGDAGSLLLGFMTIVVVLTLGDTGKTYLVLAGLVIYGLPITDTALAIVRRKMAGVSMSAPDSNHLHHMLKRAFGVKGAVLCMYAIAAGFAVLGVLLTTTGSRLVYALTLVFAAYIGVSAIKIARREQIDRQAAECEARRTSRHAAREPGAPATQQPAAEAPQPETAGAA